MSNIYLVCQIPEISYERLKMSDQYTSMMKMAEFKEFQTLLKRVLEQRGRRRQENITSLEYFFCKNWYDTMMNSKDQLKELMRDKKELRKLIIELNEEHKIELDDLERQLEKLKSS